MLGNRGLHAYRNLTIEAFADVAENISGQFGQIAVKMYGDDLATLQAAADKTRDVIATLPGT